MDPISLLLMAQSAVAAIRTGCTMLAEGKAEIDKFKKTVEKGVNDAQAIYKEVTGIWSWLQGLFAPKKQSAVVVKVAEKTEAQVKKTQKKNSGKFQFAHCPGMWDYSQYGYIITAPKTIKIKANKAGIIAFESSRVSGRGMPVKPMNQQLIDGLFQFNNVPSNSFKIDLPWRVVCKENISAFLMPANYHASYLEDLYVLPGLVDYKDYWTINFIFAVKRECEITINAGDPLIHVLPFWNKPIKANYGLIEPELMAPTLTNGFEAISSFYRKTFNQKKIFHLGNSNDGDEE